MYTRTLLSVLALVGAASAGVFPPDSQVKMLDAKSFKKAMKRNETSLVAFVAPWCGHCQRMGPEYAKAALGLYPLIPATPSTATMRETSGFLFPAGASLPPMTYDSGERTASAFFYYASRRVPNPPKKLYNAEEISNWITATANTAKTTVPRALLLTKDKKVPLLWKVLANKYAGQIVFASHRDRKGKSSVALGMEAGEKKESKVLVYAPGQEQGVRYKGLNKLEALSTFFDSVLSSPTYLSDLLAEQAAGHEPVVEEEVLTPEEEAIALEQEAQRLALLHGGFADLVDFEEALKNGGAEFHGGGGGFGVPEVKKKKESASTSVAEVTTTPTTETSTTVADAEATPTSNDEAPAVEDTEAHPKDEL
ncbi:hypothetical protein CPB85DRAFT_1332307 [Mucidula mucida]|nr:hypothetical protein CPB85DRAFT_1332307 [Mucidula mucida]